MFVRALVDDCNAYIKMKGTEMIAEALYVRRDQDMISKPPVTIGTLNLLATGRL